MRTAPFFFGKYLFILLAFFSLAGNTSFAFVSKGICAESGTESIEESHKNGLVYDQIENTEGSELAERPFSSTDNTASSEVLLQKSPFKATSYSFLIRDLKAGITTQLFPSHFFL